MTIGNTSQRRNKQTTTSLVFNINDLPDHSQDDSRNECDQGFSWPVHPPATHMNRTVSPQTMRIMPAARRRQADRGLTAPNPGRITGGIFYR
jgi:hypothetical protein